MIPGPRDCRYCGVSLFPVREHECRPSDMTRVIDALWSRNAEHETTIVKLAEDCRRERADVLTELYDIPGLDEPAFTIVEDKRRKIELGHHRRRRP